MKQADNPLSDRYNRFLEKFSSICAQFNRDPESVKIVIVTKGQPVEKIKWMVNLGAHVFGENYPEETIEKISELGTISEKIEWHMIGHLQSRKSNLVAEHFSVLQSLDSVKLAKRLNKQLEASGKIMQVLLQFNVGGEESKYGWVADDKSAWEELIEPVEEIHTFQNLKIIGLMTMPPLTENEHMARNNFKRLVELGDYLQSNIKGLRLTDYSMGTSHDYAAAIAEGATMIRIGTAIMGERSF
jgi:pyridoxal phosphate enzyme (YggS family)